MMKARRGMCYRCANLGESDSGGFWDGFSTVTDAAAKLAPVGLNIVQATKKPASIPRTIQQTYAPVQAPVQSQQQSSSGGLSTGLIVALSAAAIGGIFLLRR